MMKDTRHKRLNHYKPSLNPRTQQRLTEAHEVWIEKQKQQGMLEEEEEIPMEIDKDLARELAYNQRIQKEPATKKQTTKRKANIFQNFQDRPKCL